MTTGTRKSGFPALGALSWGSHLCHFYESRSELLSVTADFLHAGLANREAGVWVAPALLGPDKARYMLTRTAPALAEYIDAGQLQILDGAQIYSSPKTGFNGGATVGLWSKAINDALGRGFEGLRVAGDAVCNETTDWVALLDYEACRAADHRFVHVLRGKASHCADAGNRTPARCEDRAAACRDLRAFACADHAAFGERRHPWRA
jgi:hypothetical protein